MDNSRFYAALTALYPREFRERFGTELLQTHADQCREVLARPAGSGRILAWFALWLRTLADWIVSVLREHITDPHRSTGLLEAPVDAPLPWKGVLLVLLPGLAFFIAQIGQLTGVDWFFYLMYRGAYFMMIPVLIVWIWKKRFPVWGLIPVGLFIKTIADLIYSPYRLEEYYGSLVEAIYKLFPGQSVPLELLVQRKTIHFMAIYENINWWIIAALVMASIVLLAVVCHDQKRVWPAFVGFSGFLLLVLGCSTIASWEYIQALNAGSASFIPAGDSFAYIKQEFAYGLHHSCSFLLAIMIGAILARRHGRLAMLLPMGYLMSATVYGRISDDWPVDQPQIFQLMVIVAVVALLYRFTVAVAGPLWIVRSASPAKRRRAGAISLVVLILIQFGFNFYQIASSWGGTYFWSSFFWQVRWQVMYLAGIGLMAVIFQNPTRKDEPSPALANRAISLKES